MSAAGSSFRFSHAITRQPGESITHGLRDKDVGDPSPQRFMAEHEAYVEALKEAGVSVTVLPAWEEFPDSVFIEDSALCLPRCAVLMRPGAATRTGESAGMAAHLAGFYDDVLEIGEAGFIDGGDILTTETEIIVGLSARTNRAGAERLRDCVADRGHTVRILETPSDILHFKTGCGLLDEETILVTRVMDETDFFDGYRTLQVPNGEEVAANAIRVNDRVFLSSGFPKTADMLVAAGYSVVSLETSQAALVDGGLSCLSLRFSAR